MLPNSLIGQHYFRMKADFSIKEKFSDEKMALTMGTVYYDRTHKKIVYDIKFPEKETWLIMDTVFYKIQDNAIIHRQFIPMLPSSTMFESALANSLDNFGLEKSFYTLEKVEKEIQTDSTSPRSGDYLTKIKEQKLVSAEQIGLLDEAEKKLKNTFKMKLALGLVSGFLVGMCLVVVGVKVYEKIGSKPDVLKINI